MKLDDMQQRMLGGEYGDGMQRAMNMLVKYGRTFDAERLVPLDSVHIFATDPLEFVAEMLSEVESLMSLATVHACYPAESQWAEDMGIPKDMALSEGGIHARRVDLLMKAGFLPTFTCAPYLSGNLLWRNAVFSWPGTSGIIIGNSIFGARGNREASPAAFCSAITGYTPEMLYHLPEKRRAELVVQLENVDWSSFSEADYGALGYAVGLVAGTCNVALSGEFPRTVAFENLKYLLSPMPVSGAVSICHIVGLTPEAPTLEAVLDENRPVETLSMGVRDIDHAYQKLNTAKSDTVDMVLLGCPHCTIAEFKTICSLLGGKKVHPNVRFWVATGDAVYVIAKRFGFVDHIEKAGGRVFTDVCIMNMPFPRMEPSVGVSATNSARAAHYHARGGLSGSSAVQVVYGSTEKCVAAAIAGKWEGV